MLLHRFGHWLQTVLQRTTPPKKRYRGLSHSLIAVDADASKAFWSMLVRLRGEGVACACNPRRVATDSSPLGLCERDGLRGRMASHVGSSAATSDPRGKAPTSLASRIGPDGGRARGARAESACDEGPTDARWAEDAGRGRARPWQGD